MHFYFAVKGIFRPAEFTHIMGTLHLGLTNNMQLARLDGNELLEGYLLSSDIYTVDGLIAAKAGTFIDGELRQKLLYAGVFKDIMVSSVIKRTFLDAEENKKFVEFEDTYAKTEIKVQQQLGCILSGKGVNTDETTDAVYGVLGKVSNKHSVFQYLNMLKDHTDHTFAHSANVAIYCHELARWYKLSDDEINLASIAGALHDTGKLSVPLELLNKPGKLTDEEFAKIKEHSRLGYELLLEQDLPDSVKLAALQHHEKADKRGYPHGIDIHEAELFSRIVAVCDIWEALTAERPYKKRMCPFEAMELFQNQIQYELDAELVLCFLGHVGHKFIDSWVKLNNGELGQVRFINSGDLGNPIVAMESGEIYNLSESNLRIVETV